MRSRLHLLHSSALLVAVFVSFFSPSPAMGQDEPAVIIKAMLGSSSTESRYKMFNGVVAGQDEDGTTFVLTCAHCLEASDQVNVRVLGKWLSASIYKVSIADDLVMLRLNHNLPQLPVASVRGTEVEPGEFIKFCGYMPGKWEIGCIRGKRIRNHAVRFMVINIPGRGGMSGGGVYDKDNYLVGLFSREEDKQNTQIVPSTEIYRCYTKWKAEDEAQAQAKAKQPEQKAELLITKELPEPVTGETEPVKAQSESESSASSSETAATTRDKAKEWAWDGLSGWAWAAIGAGIGGPFALAVPFVGKLIHRRIKSRKGGDPDLQGGQQVPPPRNTDVGRERIVEKVVDLSEQQRSEYERRIAELEQAQSVRYPAIESDYGLSRMRQAMRLTAEQYPGARKWVKTIEDVFTTLLSGEKSNA